MTSASRRFAGEPDASHRPSADSARDAFAGSTSLAVAEEDASVDAATAEFDRRVAIARTQSADDVPFAFADFATADVERLNDVEVESLAHVLQHAGPMPSKVAEECLRGVLVAIKAVHERRWSHGALSLDVFALDACGAVRLVEVGSAQRAAWLAAADGRNGEGSSPPSSGTFDDLWNEAFLSGAADDFRRLSTHVVEPLLREIDGERPAWAARLFERLDALDGTIGALEDVDHAWRVLAGSFDDENAVDLPSLIVNRRDDARLPDAPLDAIDESPIDETAQDEPRASYPPEVEATSRVLLLWLCAAGGLAALAGTIAAAAKAL